MGVYLKMGVVPPMTKIIDYRQKLTPEIDSVVSKNPISTPNMIILA